MEKEQIPSIYKKASEAEQSLTKRYDLLYRLQDAYEGLGWFDQYCVIFTDKDERCLETRFEFILIDSNDLHNLSRLHKLIGANYGIPEYDIISIDHGDDYIEVERIIAAINKYLKEK